jgi:hypothetical protein
VCCCLPGKIGREVLSACCAHANEDVHMMQVCLSVSSVCSFVCYLQKVALKMWCGARLLLSVWSKAYVSEAEQVSAFEE